MLEVGGAEVRVGTCSWTDKTLVKDTTWYPKRSMSAAERLAFYAARFPVVEADSTYYRPPSRELTGSWAERTPDGFRFDVKAFSLMTGHPTRPDALWPDVADALADEARDKRNVYAHHLPDDAVDEVWARFVDAVRPLIDAGRFGAVLLQYPPWFTPKKANRAELARARERLGDVPASSSCGPRSGSAPTTSTAPSAGWPTTTSRSSGSTRRSRRSCPTSSPRPPTSPWSASTVAPTTRGRSAPARPRSGSGTTTRSASCGPGWTASPRSASQAREVHLLMNNCYQDYGVDNAADLVELLRDA